jgi:hypothetical protein
MNLLKKLMEYFSPEETPLENLLKTSAIPTGNFQGIPKKNLTWQEVYDMNLKIHLAEFPEICPVCGKKLRKYKSDYEKIEGGGQYMVQGIYCKEGHFTYLENA